MIQAVPKALIMLLIFFIAEDRDSGRCRIGYTRQFIRAVLVGVRSAYRSW